MYITLDCGLLLFLLGIIVGFVAAIIMSTLLEDTKNEEH
jgi:multisubunit Na+/H+ antiporter MnhB subunit